MEDKGARLAVVGLDGMRLKILRGGKLQSAATSLPTG
jgi:hypothetical protein